MNAAVVAARDGGQSGRQGGGAFNPRVMLAIIVAGALAIAAYLLLSAYSPQLSSGNNGGAHALSNSATGFSALVALAKESGLESEVWREEGGPGEGSLLVLTPEFGTSPEAVKERIDAQQALGPTLVILPKWETRRHRFRPGWVEKVGLPMIPGMQAGPLAAWNRELELDSDDRPATAGTPFSAGIGADGEPIRFAMPANPQALMCKGCDDRMTYPDGRAMMAVYWPDYPVYILADPDFLNNHGIKDKAAAAAALRLLDQLAADGEASHVAFDMTLNGFGKQRSILRFLFEPPFLAITLCLVLAAVLAGWQAFNRFGPPARRSREIALGKDALIANGAELMKQAGKDLHGAGVYARHVRDQLAQALKAPAGLEGPALEAWLDRFTPHGSPQFSALMQQMTRAGSEDEMVRTGREMIRWRKDVLREH